MIKSLLESIIGPINNSAYVLALIEFMKSALWPLTVFVLAIIFRHHISVLIQRLVKVESPKGTFYFGGPQIEPEIQRLVESRAALLKPTDETEKPEDVRTARAVAELAYLLSKYQFVWSAWITGPEFSHAVRFSEKYSGGELRYLDQFGKNLLDYEADYSGDLPPEALIQLNRLRSFIADLLPYQKQGQELAGPVFSVPKFQAIVQDLLRELKRVLPKT